MKTLIIRRLQRAEDLAQVVDLQRLIWGEDATDHITLTMLYSLAHNGCPILGAFDGERLVGFSVAFFATEIPDSRRPALANLKLASKRLAVHPDYRSSGVGYQLKWAQRTFADEQGIRLITWTYDPLNSRNAYLYIRKLGAWGRSFHLNYYDGVRGQSDALGYSDRVLCEWHITSRRVVGRAQNTRRGLSLNHYLEANTPLANPTQAIGESVPYPFEGGIERALARHPNLVLAEIPSQLPAYANNEALLRAWREHTRYVFSLLFNAGYIMSDFLHETHEGRERSFYVFGFDGLGD